VKPTELLSLLAEVYRNKLMLVRRHEAGAQAVGQYDFNNTYQYILAREEAHLSWLRDAIEHLGGSVPASDAVESLVVPGDPRALLANDAQLEQDFVDRWKPSVEQVTDARQRGMLRVLVGEALEHKRFFEQAAAGRTDLLGRHMDGVETTGQVLKTRWVE
jgi:hypothetical protein